MDHQLPARPLSYAETLRTGCEETIEATVRKRRLCFAGFVMRMDDDRLFKRVLLGTLATGKEYRGGQESSWVSRLGEDLVAFGMEDEKEGEKWKASALEKEECGSGGGGGGNKDRLQYGTEEEEKGGGSDELGPYGRGQTGNGDDGDGGERGPKTV
eukprot:g5471.t2